MSARRLQKVKQRSLRISEIQSWSKNCYSYGCKRRKGDPVGKKGNRYPISKYLNIKLSPPTIPEVIIFAHMEPKNLICTYSLKFSTSFCVILLLAKQFTKHSYDWHQYIVGGEFFAALTKYIEPDDLNTLKDNEINILSQNVRSLKRNGSKLREMLLKASYIDLIFLQEVWSPKIPIIIKGFKLEILKRTTKRGGGLGVYVKENTDYKTLEEN